MNKVKNYCSAFRQLTLAARAYTAKPEDTLYRDGMIQRFEFTEDLAWKSAREYLEDQGTVFSIVTPRAVLKEAFSAGLIKDELTWNAILAARNITSHVYDEQTAQQVATQIINEFIPALQALAIFYEA